MVNGKLTELCMKVGEAGEAYFVEEMQAGEASLDHELISSPLTSPAVSPTEMLKQLDELTQAKKQQQEHILHKKRKPSKIN